MAQVLKLLLIIRTLAGQALSKPAQKEPSCLIRSQDGGLNTCQTAVSVAQTWLYMKFHLSPDWSILQWHVNFLCQNCHCCLLSFITVSLKMIMCKSQHKELSTFCSLQLLEEMVFISPIQLAYKYIRSELLLPSVIHIPCASVMAGPPAFRFGQSYGECFSQRNWSLHCCGWPGIWDINTMYGGTSLTARTCQEVSKGSVYFLGRKRSSGLNLMACCNPAASEALCP